MNDSEQFLKIIDKFIDSVGAINQNLGPVKDTLVHLVDKVEKQNSIHEDLRDQIKSIKESIEASHEQIEKLNEVVSLLKELYTKKDPSADIQIKKLELDTQLKVAEITQQSTTVRETSAKRWAFWGLVIPAVVASIIGLVTVLVKPEKKEDNKIIERVIEKR